MTAAEIAASLSSGAARAVMAITGEWQFPGKATFAWAGAVSAAECNLVEYQLQKKPRLSPNYGRFWAYRLKPLGQRVKDALLKIKQETK